MEIRESWIDWWKRQVAGSTMEVEFVPLSTLKDWGIKLLGFFGRHNGAFYKIWGVKVRVLHGREVPDWEQTLTEENGEGSISLVVDEKTDMFLVQAKPEPGNKQGNGFMALYSALTASLSNLKQEHGGKRPPRAEFFDKRNEDLVFGVASDGGRNKEKVNNYGVVYVDKGEIVLNENERWFTRQEIFEALRQGFVCEHLLASIGLLDLVEHCIVK